MIIENQLLQLCKQSSKNDSRTDEILSLVETLVKSGGHVNFHDYNHRTMLHFLATRNNVDCVLALLKYCESNKLTLFVDVLDDMAWTPLCNACFFGKIEIYLVLKSHCANVNIETPNGKNLLHLTANNKNMDLIQYLLNDGVNASKRDCLGRTYLDILESNVQDDLENFGIDKFGRTILHWASVDESKKGMLNDHCKYLIQRQDDVGRTALMYASYPLFQNPQPEYVSMLIEMGENPNAYDIGGKRALHFAAAIKENTMIIKILLQAGADREAVDHMGQTALDIAQKCNNVENVKLLQNYFYNPSSDSNTLFMLNSKKITDDSGTLETASQTGRCNFSTSPSQYRI